MDIEKLKGEVYEYYLRAYESSLMTGTSGNASAYSREDKLMVITPSGVDVRKMDMGSMVVMDLTGNVLGGGMKPSSEWRMHAEIYKRRSEAGAVLHTHSKNAAAFAVCGMEIPEILVEMRLFLNGAVPVCPYAEAGSQRLAELTAETLKNSGACLMQNHGVTAVGETMEEAFIRALYVEEAAEIYLKGKLLGEPLKLP